LIKLTKPRQAAEASGAAGKYLACDSSPTKFHHNARSATPVAREAGRANVQHNEKTDEHQMASQWVEAVLRSRANAHEPK
jgi:enoyl-[acyl-carrier-protein] reductase (NADH)